MFRFGVRIIVLAVAIFGASMTFAGDQIVAATLLSTFTLIGLSIVARSFSARPAREPGAVFATPRPSTIAGRVREPLT